jgi:hypothetical protein
MKVGLGPNEDCRAKGENKLLPPTLFGLRNAMSVESYNNKMGNLHFCAHKHTRGKIYFTTCDTCLLFIYMFICGLFSNDVSSSGCIASND